MLINADHPEECRAVIVEDGKLDEFIVEHSTQERLKGNVYLGVIARVEPAIEAAFVDFGGRKFGFLPFKDVRKESYLPTLEKKAKTRIQDVLVRGQKILIQVIKEERDAKGPTVTNFLTIPGRFLVLMIGNSGGGVSRKIEDEIERKKLKEIISGFELPESVGAIIRTAGMGRTKLELQKDLNMVLKIWETIQKDIADPEKAPFIVYQVPDMVVRTVRDHYTADTAEIIIDDTVAYKQLKAFFKLVMPRFQRRVKLYGEGKPLFSQYNIEQQIGSIYKRRVELPSGGSLVIDSGEALVSIDVNSGKTTSASELEETALKTNLEAADEIGRQLRLRDLGGLIVVDFIDMFQKKNKSLVEKQLRLACKKDKARINVARISKFGLLEMSRQRISPAVGEGAFERCSTCDGTGFTKSESMLVLEVMRKVQKMLSTNRVKVLKVEVDNQTVNYILNYKRQYLLELEDKYDVRILFRGKEDLRSENFIYSVEESREERVLEPKPKTKRGRPRKENSKEVLKESSQEVSKEKKVKTLSSLVETNALFGENVKTEPGLINEEKKDSPKKSATKRKYTRRPANRRPGPARGRGRRRSGPTKAREIQEDKTSSKSTQEINDTFVGRDVSTPVGKPAQESPESV